MSRRTLVRRAASRCIGANRRPSSKRAAPTPGRCVLRRVFVVAVEGGVVLAFVGRVAIVVGVELCFVVGERTTHANEPCTRSHAASRRTGAFAMRAVRTPCFVGSRAFHVKRGAAIKAACAARGNPRTCGASSRRGAKRKRHLEGGAFRVYWVAERTFDEFESRSIPSDATKYL